MATVVYVLVDDGYQAQGQRGAKPVFGDSEGITLLLWMDVLPFPGENPCLGFLRAPYLPLFPRLLDPSQCKRRARSLRLRMEALRRHWTAQWGATLAPGSGGTPSPSPS